MNLLEYSQKAMIHYGSYVLEERALPDYRDGLKPVQRRILWAMHELGLYERQRKAARVIGDVLGKYHPHSPDAVYGAMVTMVNSRYPLITGIGNWGSAVDPPAAYRYTEVKLSDLGKELVFHPDYFVFPTRLNFDGSFREPIWLPAKLPILLLNGTFGIAVGGISNIPSFTMESVIESLKRKTNNLKISLRMGGIPIHSPDWDGNGIVKYKPEYQWNPKKKLLYIYGFHPYAVNSLEKIANHPFVKQVSDATDEHRSAFHVYLTTRHPKALDSVLSMWYTKINHQFAVKTGGKKYKKTNINEYMEKWLKWRIKLEKLVIDTKMASIEKELIKNTEMLKACDNLQIVMQAVKKEKSEEYLAEKLGISKEGAKCIMRLPLFKLKGDLIREKIEKLQKEKEKVNTDPQSSFYGWLDEMLGMWK